MDPVGKKTLPREDTQPQQLSPKGSHLGEKFIAFFARAGQGIENLFGSLPKAGNHITRFFTRIADTFSDRKRQEHLATNHITEQLSGHNTNATTNVHTTTHPNKTRLRKDSPAEDIPIRILDLNALEKKEDKTENYATQELSYPHTELDAGSENQKIFEEKKLFSECHRRYTATQNAKWLSQWENSRERGNGFDKDEQKLIFEWLTNHVRNHAESNKGVQRLPKQRQLSEEMASPSLSGKSYIERLRILVEKIETAEAEKNNQLFNYDPLTPEAVLDVDSRRPPHIQNGFISREEENTLVKYLDNEDWFKELENSGTHPSSYQKRSIKKPPA